MLIKDFDTPNNIPEPKIFARKILIQNTDGNH
jgi:hypothetical protein